MWPFMSAVFSFAMSDGDLPFNPCARGGRLLIGILKAALDAELAHRKDAT